MSRRRRERWHTSKEICHFAFLLALPLEVNTVEMMHGRQFVGNSDSDGETLDAYVTWLA